MKYKLEALLIRGKEGIGELNEEEFSLKPSTNKWSKKEILGHLVDSGINNLQRITEVQFESKPYQIRKYNQNELVIANNYQNVNSKELVDFWLSINHQILHLIQHQTEKTLDYQIILTDGNLSNLRFLIEDYIRHLEHHLKQII